MRFCKRLGQKYVGKFEKLENRRLLVGEGELFSIQDSFSNNGLLGDITGEVRWGDGSTEALTLSGDTNVATNGVRIVIDYDLDDNNFFSRPGSREALQFAADVISTRFQDQLAAIRPDPPGISGLSYRPFIQHPAIGPSDQAVGSQLSIDSKRDIVVNANEIRLFAGGRNLRQRAANGTFFDIAAFAGPGDIDIDPVSCIPSECAEVTQRIDEFEARGQSGVLASPQTDFAPIFGSISFNTTFDWDFSIDSDSLESGRPDFLAVAMHEIAHVLGFGTSPIWSNLTRDGTFAGSNTTAAYQGSGNTPLQGAHWAPSVFNIQPTLLTAVVQTSQGRSLSDLDFAALDDLGWEARSEGDLTFSANHRYADNGTYDISIVLRGSQGGEQVFQLDTVSINNLAPSVTPAQAFTVPVGVAFQAENIGVIADPGINDAPFTFEIDWGDNTQDTGNATVDIIGDGNGGLTQASFDGTHTYDTAGVKTVTLTVTDKDGGTDEATFQITVTPPPTLTLQLNRDAVNEDDGAAAADLTVQRSGPALDSAQRVDLLSSDTSEINLPAFVEIPAGQTQVVVTVDAVDDDLLDGVQTVLISASGANLQPGEVSISVNDREALLTSFNRSTITEGETGVILRLERTNTDAAEPLSVNVSGIDQSQLDFTSPVVLPAGQMAVDIPLTTVDDDVAESTEIIDLSFSAAGYISASASIELVDDEASPFQNPSNRFDVNNESGVTANDALIVINAITRRNGNFDLDPTTEQPNGIFVDVNGDLRVSATDALQVINELARQTSPEGELAPLIARDRNENLQMDRLHDEAIGIMF